METELVRDPWFWVGLAPFVILLLRRVARSLGYDLRGGEMSIEETERRVAELWMWEDRLALIIFLFMVSLYILYAVFKQLLI